MSVDFYPATIQTDHVTGAKFVENILPMQGNCERLKDPTPGDQDDPFEPNPEYIPFSSMNMSSGNAYYILGMIGIDPGEEACGHTPIEDVFKKAHDFLFRNGRTRDMEAYVMERVFGLREMARLGIARGATHIAWA